MRKMQQLLGAALALMLAGSAAGEALALDCRPQAASSLAARPMAKPAETGRFRIFWHVATQIEDLADAAQNPAHAKEIAAVRPLADGYYINAIPGGLIAYWPKRPEYCALNFKNLQMNAGQAPQTMDGAAISLADGPSGTKSQCEAAQAKAVGGTGAAVPAQQLKALAAALGNLDVAGEQQRGKTVMGEMLLVTGDMAVDTASGALTLQKLPRTLCVLASAKIAPDAMMVYQEPMAQRRSGNLVQLPIAPGKFTANPVAGLLNNNPYGFSEMAGAFAAAGAPVVRFAPNIRRWNPKLQDSIYLRFAALKPLAAFVFEGGTVPAKGSAAPAVRTFAPGAAWILQHTDDNVVFLMPGYYTPGELAALNGIDGLIPRLEKSIRGLNADMTAAMGLAPGKNAICSSRVVLVPASYGAPMHPQTFPAKRSDGTLAGTVTGQIMLLARLRTELCGKG